MKYDITFKKTVTVEADSLKEALEQAEKDIKNITVWAVDTKVAGIEMED